MSSDARAIRTKLRGRAGALMMLPDRERARVDRAKTVDYLLSSSHPDGRGKAAFFTRYAADGPLPAPDGRAPMVRTVWIVEAGSAPRLVTAHPL